ncbi:MAG: glucose 1-dehydrogenase [Actinobacteria bacterium]|nr:glucose 1-dehydrogenase [Actinomycetota bacterium]
MRRFDNKVTMITGAGQGVGKAVAKLFAKDGASLCLVDISLKTVKRLEDDLTKSGIKALAVYADVSKITDANEAVRNAISQFGKIDILINNASVSGAKRILDITEQDWDYVFNVNVKGAFFMLQAVARKMIESGEGGCIVNISSVAGRPGGRQFLLHYAASKAAVISMTQSAALALAKNNIRVNSIAPGTIDTPMWQKVASDLAACEGCEVEEILKVRPGAIPLGRLAQPDDIAKAVVYLCSDDASYVTGQTLNVCGGLVMS